MYSIQPLLSGLRWVLGIEHTSFEQLVLGVECGVDATDVVLMLGYQPRSIEVNDERI